MSNNNEAVEKAFERIQTGNQQRSDGDHWKAASSFLEAELLLGDLAKGHPVENNEQKKIQQLYQDQSDEYLHHGRQALVDAMTNEFQKDKERCTQQTSEEEQKDPSANQCSLFCRSISDDDARARTRLFTQLFSRELEPEIVTAVATDNAVGEEGARSVEDQQVSLEDRLMQLNASLPKGLKTSNERMQDINRGLNRLGLSLYNNDDTLKKPPIEVPKSESQQVKDIIAQAQDEVKMEALTNPPIAASDDNSVVSSSDGLSSEEDAFDTVDDDGSVLSDENPKLQNVKAIKHQVAKAQAKLAELAALLDTIHDPGQKGDSLQDNDESKNDKDSAALDPAYGKATLLDAKLSLNKALKVWKVAR